VSTLTPLSFPEEEQTATTASSPFPYTSIQAGQQLAGQPGAHGVNRMQQLEAMLQEAQGRAEIIEKEAYDKAYLAGEKAGMALGKKRGEQILEAMQDSLQGVENELDVIRRSFAEAAMEVAEFIAGQIVGDAAGSDHSRLWDIAKQAATRLPDTNGLRIAVSPDDYALFKRLLEAESSMLVLCIDAGIDSGACRIISSQQDMLIDPVAAVQSCLEQLRPTLLQKDHSDSIPDTRGRQSDGDQH